MSPRMKIGTVARRTGLSLRTIRYYGQVGLAPPSARTAGGFRLYTEADVERLLLIMSMKPLGFTLEEMGVTFKLLDALGRDLPAHDRSDRVAELRAVHEDAERRVVEARKRLVAAEGFARRLSSALAHEERESQSGA